MLKTIRACVTRSSVNTWELNRLIAVNALSLAVAAIANLALLFNMARRLPFSIAQPITIVGWYISAFLLIGLIVAASYGLELPPGQDRALTQVRHGTPVSWTVHILTAQAFYYAIMAAGLYIIVASLMVVTVYGASAGHYPKEFKLSMSQRTLMLQTISYLAYLLTGATVYCNIEQWMFVDTVYWANYTLLTIGTGDYHPLTHLGRSLLFPYAIGGIIMLGLVIGSIRSLVLERGKKKLGARMMEKKRQKVLEKIERSNKSKSTLNPLPRNQTKSPTEMSEQERRELEFNIMRQIQESTSTKRKWTSLLISALAWLFLWLIGAVVFWKAEKNQDWSYFVSIYFSYVSLLTIGYGDFAPQSNSGKAFFVFWSLLAIPTLTVLISNMGDTVVKLIRDATLWFGEITVLPQEGGMKQRLKKGGEKLKGGIFTGDQDPVEEPPGGVGLAEANRDPEKGERHHKKLGKKAEAAGDKFAGEFEEGELQEAKEDERKGDKIGENIHLYHYLLVKEIRKVMQDADQTPPRKYSFSEWAWFLRLMGEDEGSSKFHRKAPVKEERKDGDAPQIAEAANDINDKEEVGEENKWSWLGARSPLMGETEEAEWVLERLTLTLERELKKQRDGQKGADPAMKDEGFNPERQNPRNKEDERDDSQNHSRRKESSKSEDDSSSGSPKS